MDLHSAINGALVLDAATGGHHHSPPDGVNGVGHESSGDGDSPSEEEGHGHIGVVSEKHRLQGVEETEVHATVDEDTNGGDGESSVQALDAVRLEGLGVDVNETVELSLTSLALGVIGQPSSGVVKGVDEEEGHGTGGTTGGDVGGELGAVAGGLGDSEGGLNGVLEGEVQGLGGAVHDTGVGLVQTTLLDHLILILDKELHSLDGGSNGLRDTSSNTSEHEVLNKSELLGITHSP